MQHGAVDRRIPIAAVAVAGVAVPGEREVARRPGRRVAAHQRRQVLRLRHQRCRLRGRHPGGAQQRGGQVVRLHQLAHSRAGPLRRRQPHDQRHAGTGIVEVGAFGNQLVVADHVAVVRHEQHQGVAQQVEALQLGDDAAHLPVEKGDRRQVAVPHLGQAAAARVAGVAPAEPLPFPRHRAGDRFMRRGQRAHRSDGGAVDQLARLRRVVEVGRVGVEEADVEKERPGSVALGEERQSAIGRPGAEVRRGGMVILRPGLEPAQKLGMARPQPRRIAVERRVEMDLRIDAPLVALEAVVRVAARRLRGAPGDVQLADQRGLVAEAGQVLGQQHLIVGQRVVQTVHAVPRQRLAGQHAGAARRADGGVDVTTLEHHAAGRQSVQRRRLDGAAAVAAERVPALLIAHDEQNVGAPRGHALTRLPRAAAGVKRAPRPRRGAVG